MSDEVSFSRYRLLSRLGQGGMGVVHRALDRETNQEVAVKIGNVPTDAAAAERFMREMRHAVAVRHPHVCSVYGSGRTDDGSIFLVMELISGPSLLDLARKRRAAPSLWLEVLRALAEGLSAVHEKEIVHRDVKPQNVMFSKRGTLKLLDFGIARSGTDETVTSTGMVVGTAAYMSPEQARAEVVDARSDLFSAGLTAASLASRGASRFANTKLDAVQKVLAVGMFPPPLLSELDAATPPEIEDLFAGGLLTIHPNDRVRSASELISLIDKCPVRHPEGEKLLARWVRGDVDDVTVLTWDASRELARARSLPADVDSQVARALALRRAALLDPAPETLNLLQAEAARGRFRFDTDFDTAELARIEKLEKHRLEPDDLRRAYEMFRRGGHVEVATRMLWAYVRARPDDVPMVRLLERSLFGRAEVDSDRSTLSIARGIKTGGLKALLADAPDATIDLRKRRPSGEQSAERSSSSASGRPSSSARSASGISRAAGAGRRPAPGAEAGRGALLAEEASGRWLMGLLLVAGSLLVAWLLIATVRAGRKELKGQDEVIHDREVGTLVDAQLRLVDQAEAMLKQGDALGAADAATRALAMQLSVETGRRALLIRARAHILRNDKPAARRDLETYLARTTDFADPGIPEVKRLLASMEEGPRRE
jgi:tRNA A-37 threonylcarbamoyl transferase component Bud32